MFSKIRLRKTTPVILQMESMECGVACLAMVLAHYGKWIPMEQLRSDCAVSKNGANARRILEVARSYGMNAEGKRYDITKLKAKAVLPCILFWDYAHFVVLTGFERNKVKIIDPGNGEMTISEEEFIRHYTGVSLQMEAGADFHPQGKKPSLIEFARKNLHTVKKPFIFMLVYLLAIGLIEYINPFFSKIYVDFFLNGFNSVDFRTFIMIMAFFCVMMAVVSITYVIESDKLACSLAVKGCSSYMWKLLHLPEEFFANRSSGDIISRKEDYSEITATFLGTIAPLFINAILAIFYIIAMAGLSPLLTVIGLTGILINIVNISIVTKKRRNLTRVLVKDKSVRIGCTITGIDMMDSIKAGGAENRFFKEWTDIHTKENNTIVKLIKLDGFIGSLSDFITVLVGNVLLFLGAWLIMEGKFTIGAVMTMQFFLNGLAKPVGKAIEAQEKFMQTRVMMERINDVSNYPEDVLFENEEYEALDDGKIYSPLSGSLEVNHLVFGYSKLSEPVLKDFSLKLDKGKSIAIVGDSGSGKSTAGKLIAGLLTPWEGDILFDGKHVTEIDRIVFRSSFAVVEQDVSMFPGTVRENIKMFDDSISDEDMISAAKSALLHNEIMKRKGGYGYTVQKDAEDFSGGQRQKIELARAFALKPSIMLLDEATSALDAKTEYEIIQSVHRIGCSCIVIAHRLSTVRSCDEIIVLDNGYIVDRGTHEELIERCEKYKNLVSQN